MPARMASLSIAGMMTISTSAFILFCMLFSLPHLSLHSTTSSLIGGVYDRQPLFNSPPSANRVIIDDYGHQIRTNISTSFPYHAELHPKIPELIWQTWKYKTSDKDFTWELRQSQESWTRQHPTHKHMILNDKESNDLIKSLYSSPAPDVYEAYISMPLNVHRADFFRYLILFAKGGTYSDIDTEALKPVWEWMPESGTAIEQRVGLVVGIEADPDRADWSKWYSRRVQLCQWTIRSKPGHPILADIIAKITQETLRMKREHHITPKTMDRTTMEYTGPGIWSDSVFGYLSNPQYITAQDKQEVGPLKINDTVSHLDFTGLRNRRLVGDVLMLPITSFSPGQGHMGSGSTIDPLAFVRHKFLGSWKNQEYFKGH